MEDFKASIRNFLACAKHNEEFILRHTDLIPIWNFIQESRPCVITKNKGEQV